MRLAAGFVLNQELSMVVFYPPLYGLFWWTLSQGAQEKAMGDHGIK